VWLARQGLPAAFPTTEVPQVIDPNSTIHDVSIERNADTERPIERGLQHTESPDARVTRTALLPSDLPMSARIAADTSDQLAYSGSRNRPIR
jgi:hypothetical protein